MSAEYTPNEPPAWTHEDAADAYCDNCGRAGPPASMTDMSFRGPDGEAHPRQYCERCYRDVIDDALSQMGDEC